MQRRKFVKSSLLAATALTAGAGSLEAAGPSASQKAMLEWREYEMHFGTSENDLHNYLQHALIPALNRLGVKNVGVFRELSKSEPAKIYLLIAYGSPVEYFQVISKLPADSEYRKAAADYMNLPVDKVPFTRYSTKLMIAFDGLPQLAIPAAGSRVFELRTYEGANEDALRRKIKMFNEEEFTIFYRTRLNPVFFGEVISGKDMPCLTYMISFRDMEEHDKAWAAFGSDPDWKRVSGLAEYANSVSRIQKTFLEPLNYSQL